MTQKMWCSSNIIYGLKMFSGCKIYFEKKKLVWCQALVSILTNTLAYEKLCGFKNVWNLYIDHR